MWPFVCRGPHISSGIWKPSNQLLDYRMGGLYIGPTHSLMWSHDPQCSLFMEEISDDGHGPYMVRLQIWSFAAMLSRISTYTTMAKS